MPDHIGGSLRSGAQDPWAGPQVREGLAGLFGGSRRVARLLDCHRAKVFSGEGMVKAVIDSHSRSKASGHCYKGLTQLLLASSFLEG
jgi:hypothetical protein